MDQRPPHPPVTAPRGTPECFAGGRAPGCGAADRPPGRRTAAPRHESMTGRVSRGHGYRSGGVGVQPIGGIWHLVDVGSGGERRPGEYGGRIHRVRGRRCATAAADRVPALRRLAHGRGPVTPISTAGGFHVAAARGGRGRFRGWSFACPPAVPHRARNLKNWTRLRVPTSAALPRSRSRL